MQLLDGREVDLHTISRNTMQKEIVAADSGSFRQFHKVGFQYIQKIVVFMKRDLRQQWYVIPILFLIS